MSFRQKTLSTASRLRSIAVSRMDFRVAKRNQFQVRIDLRLHIVRNRAASSGGWLRSKRWHRAAADEVFTRAEKLLRLTK
jgi:hypothetical protein